MDQKDKKNIENSQEQIMEKDDDRAGSEKRRILVKLMLPKMSTEAAESEPPTAPEAKIEEAKIDEAKRHYCRQCDRSFSSGKALGGHMSSAHVQGNKEFSGKKLKTNNHKGGDSSSPYTCSECRKVFPTEKSLCGHMRSHPGREWRGIHPPMRDKRFASPEDSSGSARSRDHDQTDSGYPVEVELTSSLGALPSSAKRPRGSNDPPPPPAAAWGEEVTEVIAAHQLMRMLNSKREQVEGSSRPELYHSCLQRKLKINDNPGRRPETFKINDNHGQRPELFKINENQGPRPEMDRSCSQKKVKINENQGRADELEDRAPELIKKQKIGSEAGFDDSAESDNGKGKEKIHCEGTLLLVYHISTTLNC